jgi:hypothetical protein
MKAAAGRTKTRLATDPARGPIITQIYQWRVRDQLGAPTIRTRLNADPAAYPPPDPDRGWTHAGIYKILANPKYTGYQVLGRTHITGPGKKVPVPLDKWIWSAKPTHPALVDKPTWDTAQHIGAQRGNVQDAEQPKPGPAAATGTGEGCGAKSANGACAGSPAKTAGNRPGTTPTTSAPTTPATGLTPPPTPTTPTWPSAKRP